MEYTTPAYRDCSVGKYLYAELHKKGIHQLVFNYNSEKHEPYLEKMGYSKVERGYVKVLDSK